MFPTSSPTTFAFDRYESRAASPRTSLRVVDVPSSADDADRLLAGAARAVGAGQEPGRVAEGLARFLGASSHLWTSQRRARLRELLYDLGTDGIVAVLAAVAAAPHHPEVSDEAERVLERFGASIVPLLAGVVEGRAIGLPKVAEPARSAPVRATAVRVIAEIHAPRARTSSNPRMASPDAFSALVRALHDDPAAEVRDAAAFGLGKIGGPGAHHELKQRLSTERDGVVRESIENALEELKAGG